jgi:hypothetical protein
MSWEVEYTDEFEQWWEELDADEQESVTASVGLLEEMGDNLPFPHSSGVNGSKHSKMRELRFQHKGDPYRILYAFDPRCAAILSKSAKEYSIHSASLDGDDTHRGRFVHD